MAPPTAEQEPLLQSLSQTLSNTSQRERRRSSIADADLDGDPDNPLEWPAAFKWTIVALLALMAFTV
jgi:hypothetical protein